MNNKKIIASLIFGIFLISMIGMATAAITYVNPTASQYLKSEFFTVNVTYAASDIEAVTNFSDGNSSIFFNNVQFSTYNGNRGCDATNCWAQIRTDDTNIPEGTYLLKVSLGNQTLKLYANATQTITIDRTNPSLVIKETSVNKGRPINYKCSDNNINAFTVSNGVTTNTLTASSTDYVQYVPLSAGTYTFTCTDLAGNSASQSIVVSKSDGFAQPPLATTQTQLDINNFIKQYGLWILIGILVLVLLNNKK